MGLRLAGRQMGFRVACVVLSCWTAHSFATAVGKGGNEPVPEGGGPCAALNGPICVGADSACQFSDLQEAIDSASESGSAETTILIAGNQDYDGERLFVFNRNLTLRGGYSSCSDSTASGVTTLHGVATGSVISIGADAGRRSVRLENLEIRGGGGNDPIGFHTFSFGGGVNIGGDVEVTIANSEISHNGATFGGGIAVGGENGAQLMLVDTDLVDNAAANGVNGAAHSSGRGGGIYCRNEGNRSIDITMEGGQILGNVAVADSNGTTKGGGVYLEACAFAGTAIEVTLNIAAGEDGAGGGFYGTAGGFGSLLQLNGSNAGPSLLNANIAGGNGGGIWAHSTVMLDSVAVEDNIAGFSGVGAGGGVYLFGTSPLTMGSEACTGCSTLVGNSATDPGAAIFGSASQPPALTVTIADTRISGNGDAQSAAVIDLSNDDDDVWLDMSNDLVIGNSAGDAFAIVRSEPAGHVQVTSSTFADNTVAALFSHDELDPGNPPPFRLYNIIVRENSGVPVVLTQDGVDVQCVIAHEGNGLPAGPTVLTDDPRFVDADAGDYHLQSNSRAIDFCTETTGVPDEDLDGNPRGVDAPSVPPYVPDATYDLGAYEWQPEITDRIFADGFDS